MHGLVTLKSCGVLNMYSGRITLNGEAWSEGPDRHIQNLPMKRKQEILYPARTRVSGTHPWSKSPEGVFTTENLVSGYPTCHSIYYPKQVKCERAYHS